jgi:hypothetical protein
MVNVQRTIFNQKSVLLVLRQQMTKYSRYMTNDFDAGAFDSVTCVV